MTTSNFALTQESKSAINLRAAIADVGGAVQAFAIDQIKIGLIEPKFDFKSHNELIAWIADNNESVTNANLRKQINNYRTPVLKAVKKLATVEQIKKFKEGTTSGSLSKWLQAEGLGKTTCEKLNKAMADMAGIEKDLDVALESNEAGNARIILNSATEAMKVLEKFSKFEAVEKARCAAQDVILRTKDIEQLEVQETEAQAKKEEAEKATPAGVENQEPELAPTGDENQEPELVENQEPEKKPEPVKMTVERFSTELHDLVSKALAEGVSLKDVFKNMEEEIQNRVVEYQNFEDSEIKEVV